VKERSEGKERKRRDKSWKIKCLDTMFTIPSKVKY
jgi:hypothetical protein